MVKFQSKVFNTSSSVPVAVSNKRTIRSMEHAIRYEDRRVKNILTFVAAFGGSNPLTYRTRCHGLVFQFREQPTDVRVKDTRTPDPLPIPDRVFLITDIFISGCDDMREFMTDIMFTVCPDGKPFLDFGFDLKRIF